MEKLIKVAVSIDIIHFVGSDTFLALGGLSDINVYFLKQLCFEIRRIIRETTYSTKLFNQTDQPSRVLNKYKPNSDTSCEEFIKILQQTKKGKQKN